jgi:beta-glucosidase
MKRQVTPLFLCALLLAAAATGQSASSELYRNPAASVDERITDLIGRMTLDEKIQQLVQVMIDQTPDDNPGLEKYFATNSPGILCVDYRKSAAQNAEKLSAIQRILRTRTRLGIPALAGCEALHGVMIPPCTIYPQSIALGSTWDPPLVKQMASEIAEEAAAAGLSQVMSPVLDLGREPRYGRIEETYGECPTLVSRMGVAFITGFQGDNVLNGLAPNKAYCMTKHFAGYSVPANGINISPILIGEREMRTLHLIPFEAAITEALAMSVMPSYNSVDAMPSHANRWLLTQVLRREWGFQGYVYSDWDGIDFLVGHRVARDNTEAAFKAITAGVDLEAPEFLCFKGLPGLVHSKQLDVQVIDQAVSHVLRAKFLAGLFENRRADGNPETVARSVHTSEHVATSRELAQESIILLKNDRRLLPLDAAKLKSIAIIGPNAAQVEFGDYSWTKANSDGVSFLKALTSQFGGRFKIKYAKGCDLVGLSTNGFAAAVRAARQSDVAVVVLGDTSMIISGRGWEDTTLPSYGTVGEGFDVVNPVPPGVQGDLVKAVAATGKPTIVVLLNGRPYCLPWMKASVPAIVEAFYPGEQQGNAMVDILFGKVNPSGRLPVTLAPTVGHLPCTYDFKPYGRGYYHVPGSPTAPGRDYVFDSPAPLWPFGFGLSYTQFGYSGLKLDTTKVSTREGVLKFSLTVKNMGPKTGKVVAQTYWRLLHGEIAPPEKRLLRFEKLELTPGESRILKYEIPVVEFRQLTTENKWVVEPAPIELEAGDNAESISQTAEFEIIP